MSDRETDTFSLPDDLVFNSARNVKPKDIREWLSGMLYPIPLATDENGLLEKHRSRLQQLHNERVVELYRGRMPASCIDDLNANRRDMIDEYTTQWKQEGTSPGDLEGRIETLKSWIDDKISDIVLGPTLAYWAREHDWPPEDPMNASPASSQARDSSFKGAMTSIATDMAAGRSNDVKGQFTGLLKACPDVVHDFLMHDKKKNESRFYGALLTHFIEPQDPSYNPFQLLSNDRRSSRTELAGRYRADHSWIMDRINRRSFMQECPQTARKAADDRDEAAKYVVEAWTPSEDKAWPPRFSQRVKILFGAPRPVEYLPLTIDTGADSSYLEPAASPSANAPTQEEEATLSIDRPAASRHSTGSSPYQRTSLDSATGGDHTRSAQPFELV